MTSLKEELVRYLSNAQSWHSKGLLTDTMQWFYYEKGVKKKYLSETVGRKLRELESEGLKPNMKSRIAVKDDGVSVQYKFLPLDRRENYIPVSERIDKNKLFRI